MKFNSWSMKRIREGKKTLTSRKIPYYEDPDVGAVVGPVPWWFIKQYLYDYEGADNPEELQRVIDQIFRREVKREELFYVHVIIPERVLE